MKNTYLAVDFGGGSGRVMAGYIDEGKLILEEVHRFGNRQVKLGNHVYWDFPALFQDMKDGLKKAAQKGYQVKSIGIDTWGVDFGLIDKNGNLLYVFGDTGRQKGNLTQISAISYQYTDKKSKENGLSPMLLVLDKKDNTISVYKARILQDNAAQTQALEQYLNPVPVPA